MFGAFDRHQLRDRRVYTPLMQMPAMRAPDVTV
ncbi:hypothetical protein XFF6991_150082 [Xanthomonas phaseoli pv. phaseoli]|uniref:Uncharacterized protein n=1 Tax=Xanthomonas campestris pv. phaseoli TaxID=317013 RepID=A0A7Z7NG64_XANCH|nr:hypothetical protein XFF6991_150082 [Xanthomonas phaseoli pv. phaseoli]